MRLDRMTTDIQPDYIGDYETALAGLKSAPDDVDLQHAAVLALARAGSLNFARQEFERFGLNSISDHEDIMALGGRLAKDMSLKMQGEQALQFARNSAQKYEAAFQASGGYYSGINAATMMLLANAPREEVGERALNILEMLPSAESTGPTDHYFNQATRAECFLLLGNPVRAIECLRAAITFDPLNYSAHASTLKQFHLIFAKTGLDTSMLDPFSAPRPAHFSGHIWNSGQGPDEEEMTIAGTDAVQKNDIGYGFGGLAAGADIICAEALLENGAQLNIILPADAETFADLSVRPFGTAWESRYRRCIDQAKNVTILPSVAPDVADAFLFAGRAAMGHTVLKAQQFAVGPSQLLIWDQLRPASYTAKMAAEWGSNLGRQIILPITMNQRRAPRPGRNVSHVPVYLLRSGDVNFEKFVSPIDAIRRAMSYLSADPSSSYALCFDSEPCKPVLHAFLNRNWPGTILAEEAVAACLALEHDLPLDIHYAGLAAQAPEGRQRCYTISAGSVGT